jgi:bifunctional non-homologous end joining protein LigD
MPSFALISKGGMSSKGIRNFGPRCWLLERRPDGIFLSDFEQGEIGPDLFRKACEFGLEGLVSKRSDRPYHGVRLKDWIKVKNRKHRSWSV